MALWMCEGSMALEVPVGLMVVVEEEVCWRESGGRGRM